MHATVRRNEGVVGNRTDALGRQTGEAVARELREFQGFRSHDRWLRHRGTNPPDFINGKVRAEHVRVVPSPQPSVGKPRGANALPRSSADAARSSRLSAAWVRGSGRGECR